MFSITKSRELDEVHMLSNFVNRRHYGKCKILALNVIMWYYTQSKTGQESHKFHSSLVVGLF